MSSRLSRKTAMNIIAQALNESKLGHNEFTPSKTDYQQLSEGQKIEQAIDDTVEQIDLPHCPNCGGRLVFTDKSKGGGIVCVGKHYLIYGEQVYTYQGGCGWTGYWLNNTINELKGKNND